MPRRFVPAATCGAAGLLSPVGFRLAAGGRLGDGSLCRESVEAVALLAAGDTSVGWATPAYVVEVVDEHEVCRVANGSWMDMLGVNAEKAPDRLLVAEETGGADGGGADVPPLPAVDDAMNDGRATGFGPETSPGEVVMIVCGAIVGGGLDCDIIVGGAIIGGAIIGGTHAGGAIIVCGAMIGGGMRCMLLDTGRFETGAFIVWLRFLYGPRGLRLPLAAGASKVAPSRRRNTFDVVAALLLPLPRFLFPPGPPELPLSNMPVSAAAASECGDIVTSFPLVPSVEDASMASGLPGRGCARTALASPVY